MKKAFAKKLVKLVPGSKLHDGFNCGSEQWWGLEVNVDGDEKIITADEYTDLDLNMADPKDNPTIYEIGCGLNSKGLGEVLYCQGDLELMASAVKLLIQRVSK